MSRRYLLGILVYNGQDVVPACLRSAATLVTSDVTVMVFDDCSPAPGWSEQVRELCDELGLGYYRSPRNIGIPRNMNLVMRTGLDHGYDVVGLVNSDVVLPTNLVAVMDEVLDAGGRIGSVTPWSNNVSSFSLPMQGAQPQLADAGFVSAMSSALHDVNGNGSIAIPTGVGYCLMIPTAAIREVGLMDPIFGRGYCEEVDWCQRARNAGLVNVLSTGSFVYHEGSATNRVEGLLGHGMSTVAEHELIVQGRYPGYMDRVYAFFDDGSFEQRCKDALGAALRVLVQGSRFDLVLGDPSSSAGSTDRSITLAAGGAGEVVRISVHGMSGLVPGSHVTGLDVVATEFGWPRRVRALAPGALARTIVADARRADIAVVEDLSYPAAV